MARDGPARWLDEARRRHRAGDPEGALKGYARCLERAPDQPDIRLLAAMAASQAGRPQEAVRHARRAVAVRDDGAGRLTLGRVLLEAGDPEQALDCFRAAAGDPAVAADAAFHAGQALRRLQRPDEAADSLRSVLERRPDHGPAWREFGMIRMQQGQAAAAAEAFRKALALGPGDPATMVQLADACLRSGDPSGAAAALQEALRIAPEFSPALAGLGALERSRGRLPEALAAWERSIELDPESAGAWAGLASARQAAGDMAGAETAYRRALALDPARVDAVAGLAEWLDWSGRPREGLELVEGVSGERRTPGLALVTGRLLLRLGREQDARRCLEGAVPDPGSDAVLRRQFAFSLGDACDGMGDAEAAWAWYEEGNRLTPAHFDAQGHRRRMTRLQTLPPAAAGEGRGEGIVFVLGMPRSGTTLVEQILACHPEVAAAGELPVLGRLVHGLEDEDGIDPTAVAAVGDGYLASVAEVRGGRALLTDKMPLNYQYLGFIAAGLPGASIVHCRRDLRDVALSCYFTDFIDPALGFATRLDWLADYLLVYRDFMAGWRDRLRGRMLEIDYESMVADPEPAIRKLLDALGLSWEPACLKFHAADRFAATASHAQVRRPIYRTSAGRWRAYERHLAPLLERLQPAV